MLCIDIDVLCSWICCPYCHIQTSWLKIYVLNAVPVATLFVFMFGSTIVLLLLVALCVVWKIWQYGDIIRDGSIELFKCFEYFRAWVPDCSRPA